MATILIADPLPAAVVAALRAAGHEVRCAHVADPTAPGVLPVDAATSDVAVSDVAVSDVDVSDVDVLLVRTATPVDEATLGRMPALAAVGRAGTGLDHIDVDACTRRGIPVFHTPAAATTSVAELTMALMLALHRPLHGADVHVRDGGWDRSAHTCVELAGRRLCVIGCGRIGSAVARRALAFGMSVDAVDPYIPAAPVDGVRLRSLDEGLASADVVTLHVPLTEETRGMINGATLARVKPGARLLNLARGSVVDERALADALTKGQLAAAALDVFEREPLPAGSPLRAAPNLILSPHLGAATAEAQQRMHDELVDKITRFLANGDRASAENAAALDAAEGSPVR